jgi:Autotransporter beta-domain
MRIYLDAAVSGGPQRLYHAPDGTPGHRANGSTNGGDLDGLVAGGYDWKKGNLTIGPQPASNMVMSLWTALPKPVLWRP